MSKDTPIGQILKGIEGGDALVPVWKLARYRGERYPSLYPKLLMACESEQMNFLVHLWDRIESTHEAKLVWIGLIKNGFFTELLDTRSSHALDLIRACSFPIETLREQYARGRKL